MKKYNLAEDHREIKKQIKEWELSLDNVIDKLLSIGSSEGTSIGLENALVTYTKTLEDISNEMMAINI